MIKRTKIHTSNKKNLPIKWHHFREHIKRGTSKIVYIETNEQQAETMTK